MNKKYELLPLEQGKRLHRIKALRDFGSVKAGDIGGYVKSEENLSHDGNCWIFKNAKVYEDAKVYDDAIVYDDAKVCDNAKVCNHATVRDNAIVRSNAMVYDNAKVYDNAEVYSNAEVYDNARVYGYAKVFNNATVYGNAKVYSNAEVYCDAIVDGNAEVIVTVTGEILNITGLAYNVTITDNHIKIGCKCHTKEEWNNFSDDKIDEMDNGALEFWKKYKTSIMVLADMEV